MTDPRLRSFILFVALGLLAGADDPVPKRQDPQSTFEPRSGPGAGQKFLEKFAGDWDVVKTFYPRTGEPAKSRGECRQTMVHEGRFLRSEFVFGEGAAKSTGTGMIGFEAGPGTFTSVWTDSRSTAMSLRQSRDKFDGKEIVLFSKSLDAEPKNARTSRTVTRLEDDGRKIVHRQYVPGPDGKERVIMELEMTRKGSPAAASQ
jgi:hypothetical protein